MYKTLVILFAIFLAGCGGSDDAPDDGADAQANAKRPDGMSREFLAGVVERMEKEYPPTGHDIWTLADEVLSHGDNPSNEEFERRLTNAVLAALRVRAENIFAAVCVGRDPPGTDDLKFIVINRTGRPVAAVDGVLQIRSKFGSTVESLKLKIDKPIPPGGQADHRGHWSLPDSLLEQLSEGDKRYQTVFIAGKVTYGDGTVEQFP